jgi:hypothetical protein
MHMQVYRGQKIEVYTRTILYPCAYIHIYVCRNVFVCVYIYMCVCVCVCMYVWIQCAVPVTWTGPILTATPAAKGKPFKNSSTLTALTVLPLEGDAKRTTGVPLAT